jgi:SAM-dependent methyltransferase
LLPREALLVTGDVDHADWNYTGLLGFVSRRRFALALSMLPKTRVGSLLELGYGSGVFSPLLAQRCERLYGIDVHEHDVAVAARLAEYGVNATLAQASAEALPFDDASMDAIVAISTFEFIPDVAKAAREIARVLTPSGVAIVVTPGNSPLIDLALKIATGEDAKRDFGDRRAAIVPGLRSALDVDRTTAFPPGAPIVPTLYTCLRLRRRVVEPRIISRAAFTRPYV